MKQEPKRERITCGRYKSKWRAFFPIEDGTNCFTGGRGETKCERFSVMWFGVLWCVCVVYRVCVRVHVL